MLDFEFRLRWGRVVYIGILGAIIGYWFSIPAGFICLLGILDIKFEKGLFNFGEEETEVEVNRSSETFGPDSGTTTRSGTQEI
jgi:hypothetical protein